MSRLLVAAQEQTAALDESVSDPVRPRALGACVRGSEPREAGLWCEPRLKTKRGRQVRALRVRADQYAALNLIDDPARFKAAISAAWVRGWLAAQVEATGTLTRSPTLGTLERQAQRIVRTCLELFDVTREGDVAAALSDAYLHGALAYQRGQS